MRIVIQPADGDGERKVTVYDDGAREKLDEFTVDEYEQGEIALKPEQHVTDYGEHPPNDAAEVWAEIDIDERRVVRE